MPYSDQQLKTAREMIKQRQKLTWKQSAIEHLMRLGLTPGELLELRLSRKEQTNIFKLAQTAANAFFSAFNLYPNALAVHSTIAHLFEASEFTVTAKYTGDTDTMLALCGSGLEMRPLQIVIDESLDTKTVAVRFELDIETVTDEVIEMFLSSFDKEK